MELSSSIRSITTLAEEARFSSLLAVSLPPRSVPLSQSHGKGCLLRDSSWVSVSVQKTPRSPSTRQKWPQLGFEVPSSCSGNFGLWPVSSFLLVPSHLLTVARRYLLGLLRQRHCQRHWSHFLASPARLSVHSILHPWLWYLLLSRVPSLAYEARQARQGLPINVALASSSHHRRKGLLLLERYIRGGTQGGSWRGLLLPPVGLFRRA